MSQWVTTYQNDCYLICPDDQQDPFVSYPWRSTEYFHFDDQVWYDIEDGEEGDDDMWYDALDHVSWISTSMCVTHSAQLT